MGGTQAVTCKGLHKRFGKHVALAGLDLAVPTGSIFGFLGPNGAGKSTTLRILARLIRADRGSASLFGIDARRHVEASKRATFLIENAVFPPHLSARAVLRRTASFMGVKPDGNLLDRVGLTGAAHRKTGGFSHGMRQRLGLACSLLGAPDLLILDEPQNGLDPRGLRMLRSILREEHERGATVLVSVHRLAEVEGLCTHAALVAEGRILRAGAVDDLLRTDHPRYRLEVDDAVQALDAILKTRPGLAVKANDGALFFEGERALAADIASACVAAGLKVYELAPMTRTLDELYLEEIEE